MKKRPRRKSQKPPPAGGPRGVSRASVRAAADEPGVDRALHYKVVELSSVDEAALEGTLNDWVTRGWTFEAVQFAMRESSKRPAMAFVFFTRTGAPDAPSEADSRARLARLARLPEEGGEPPGNLVRLDLDE